MDKSTISEELLEQLKKLSEKYGRMGQDLSSYLDGLLYADFLTYWDYIHLDTLLSLQNPKTSFPDEQIFIIYHQITELYFRLILVEMEQMTVDASVTEEFNMRLARIIRYFKHLENSFEIMTGGMEKEQFLKFRMSLLPSSGFQSVQYRKIEIYSSDIINLVNSEVRDQLKENGSLSDIYKNLYWQSGATELSTGKKTLTLSQFDQKYGKELKEFSNTVATKNLWQVYKKHHYEKEETKNLMRAYDSMANIFWPLAHYKSAVNYLQKDPNAISATGGTNWQQYLPPKFQKVIFFPELWSQSERDEWGKGWLMKELLGHLS